jgi:hypothetical protein
MRDIILTKSQLDILIEQGSNSVAMDLDIYTQPVQIDYNNGNGDIEESLEDSIDKLNELLSMFDVGKKISTEDENSIFKILDDINTTFEKIKYQD